MRKTLWNADSRKELMSRLERLEPGAMPLWGKMSAPQMLAHLANWSNMADGTLPTVAWPGVLRVRPVGYLAIYWLPFPKGVPTAKELISRDPTGFAEKQLLHYSIVHRHDRRAARREDIGSLMSAFRSTTLVEHIAQVALRKSADRQ